MKLIQVFVEQLIVAQSRLHVANVVFASAKIVRNVAKLLNFVTQKTVERRSSLEKTNLRACLADFGANFSGESVECLVVRSESKVVVFDSVLGCYVPIASAEHFLLII